MNHDSYDDGYIRGILNTVKTIAMVGVSANTVRPSYFVFKYLLERGYRMIPVNPGFGRQGTCSGNARSQRSSTSPRRSTGSTSSAPRSTCCRWSSRPCKCSRARA